MEVTQQSTLGNIMLPYISKLTLDNPVFCCFIFWASVLVIKMLLMSLITGFIRIRYKIVINEEDLVFKDVALTYNDQRVERSRRAHRNDMENILPFFTMALMYICTDPNPTMASYLFRIAGVARILHTLVYAFCPVPQPARGIIWWIAFLVTMYMACEVVSQTFKYI